MLVNNPDEYRICNRCIMDTTVPEIRFDVDGICNFCQFYDKLRKTFSIGENSIKLKRIIKEIKRKGHGKEYDIIHGISGGTDSIYSLYVLKKLGLRPLALHVDNGWNSEIAVRNIERATKELDVDLYTWVLDWNEFRKLQISFLKASVPDLEVPTDYVINGAFMRIAAREGVSYYSHGHSFQAEGTAPKMWTYMDGRYIESIYHKFTGESFKDYPNLHVWDLFYYNIIRRIREFRILGYVKYDKSKARRIISNKLGWEDYGGHHFESYYSKFVHSYVFPRKFGIDYRKVALSADIRSGNIGRLEAIDIVKQPIDKGLELDKELEYIVKKLEITDDELKKFMSASPKTFMDYPNYYHLINKLKFFIRIGTRFGILPKAVEKYIEED